MAKRRVSSSEIRERLRSSFGNVQFEPEEETKPPWRTKQKEFSPIKSQSKFKQEKLDKRIENSEYDRMDARDMLLYFKNKVEESGNKCPITINGTQHNLMKALIQKYG